MATKTLEKTAPAPVDPAASSGGVKFSTGAVMVGSVSHRAGVPPHVAHSHRCETKDD
ncbi:hypothetical protein MICRO11B_150007 [Micrococcus luteus]|nr:hypothetical protein MICRO11B_150007 [Micrococcus luteus]